ncbi:MAG: BlaI/MecI/CopY family transcriptional regulator [Firmicutes bacterium]|nr:BlaI/MecI/CopY family transcriptional regulator [Bacillota bacterium]
MKKDINRIPDSELNVMQALWACGEPAGRAQIEEKMQERNDRKEPLAQTTLLTLLSRLEQKGFIKTEKQGRSSVYTPLVTRESYQKAQSRSFVDKLFSGSMSAFASALSEGGLTEDELKELRKLLEEKR